MLAPAAQAAPIGAAAAASTAPAGSAGSSSDNRCWTANGQFPNSDPYLFAGIRLTSSQVDTAQDIADVAAAKKLDDRAVQIAVAAAMQASKLDPEFRIGKAVGLFARKGNHTDYAFGDPLDPAVAAQGFFSRLTVQVPGYRTDPRTDAEIIAVIDGAKAGKAAKKYAKFAEAVATSLTSGTISDLQTRLGNLTQRLATSPGASATITEAIDALVDLRYLLAALVFPAAAPVQPVAGAEEAQEEALDGGLRLVGNRALIALDDGDGAPAGESDVESEDSESGEGSDEGQGTGDSGEGSSTTSEVPETSETPTETTPTTPTTPTETETPTEPSDGEPSDGEPSDSEPSDSEPSDSEPSDSEPSDSEPSDTETSSSSTSGRPTKSTPIKSSSSKATKPSSSKSTTDKSSTSGSSTSSSSPSSAAGSTTDSSTTESSTSTPSTSEAAVPDPAVPDPDEQAPSFPDEPVMEADPVDPNSAAVPAGTRVEQASNCLPVGGSPNMFDPGSIISDAVFYDSDAMSTEQISRFVSAMGASCDSEWCLRSLKVTVPSYPASRYCKAYPGGSQTAAEAIAGISRACGINPQVMLVTLQKEAGLLTRSNVTESSWDAAWGWHCPDTGPGGSANCDPQYAGFANQLHGMSEQWARYRLDPQKYNYRAGMIADIRWNVEESGCGSSAVYIRNTATASLYNYTPYQPNAASLSAYPGAGDECSSYGNRNFFVMFGKYFGGTGAGLSAETAVTGKTVTLPSGANVDPAVAGRRIAVPNANVARGIAAGLAAVGMPYVWGGGTNSGGADQGCSRGGGSSNSCQGVVGFDCSGLTAYVLAQAGFATGTDSSSQRAGGQRISWNAALAGDIIGYPGHVAIYLGTIDGVRYLLEAPSVGRQVQVRSVHTSNIDPVVHRYWR